MELEHRLVELRKEKISLKKNWQKNSMFHVKQFLKQYLTKNQQPPQTCCQSN